jgi:DNA-binding response OmpR family regulator
MRLLQVEEPTWIFQRAELEERMCGWGEGFGSDTIEVHVHSLWRKIGAEQTDDPGVVQVETLVAWAHPVVT